MYGGVQGAAIVPVVAAAGTAAVLPTTGADTTVSIALTLAAGLITWGVVYYYRVIRGNKSL